MDASRLRIARTLPRVFWKPVAALLLPLTSLVGGESRVVYSRIVIPKLRLTVIEQEGVKYPADHAVRQAIWTLQSRVGVDGCTGDDFNVTGVDPGLPVKVWKS